MHKLTRFGAVVAIATAGLVGTAAIASAAECGQPAVYKTVTTPASDAVYEDRQVEVTPAVEEVSHTVVVVDSPAVEAVAGQHYSLKGNSGIGKDETPVFPADYWQANTAQEPHSSDNVTWVGTPGQGLHYTSHGSEGLRDWFYFQAPVEGKPAVTHEEKVIDVEAKPATYKTESVLVKDAVAATSKQVLVSEATKPCVKKPKTTPVAPVNHDTTPPSDEPQLAFTGSQTAPLTGIAGLLLLLGVGAIKGARRLT